MTCVEWKTHKRLDVFDPWDYSRGDLLNLPGSLTRDGPRSRRVAESANNTRKKRRRVIPL